MERRLAVIDLGTNTFHLLILSTRNGKLHEIFRQRQQVYLAEEGIQLIGDQAKKRAINTLSEFKDIIDSYDVADVKAVATAAFRIAKNSSEIVDTIFEKTGIRIEIISGDREAELIYKGVSLTFPMQASKSFLIMDIGGGSVEFILVSNKIIQWAKSFPIGVAILHHTFHRQDPIPAASITELNKFLDDELKELFNRLADFEITALIGASGSFEVMEGMVDQKKTEENCSILNTQDFYPVCHHIVSLDYQARLKLEKLPANRANLVVTGLLLMKFILERIQAPNIIVSKYALKEGLAREILVF